MKTAHKNTLLAALTAGLLGYAGSVSADTNLLHRWSFNDAPGTTAIDSVGGANGTLRVAGTNGAVPTLDGSYVNLDGLGGYIDLPNGIVSSLTNLTVELWVVWNGQTSDGENQRLFDFGCMLTNGVGNVEDVDGSLKDSGSQGDSYIYATPDFGAVGAGDDFMRFAATTNWPTYPLILTDPLDFLTGTEAHIVCTFGEGWMRMFYDGIQSDAGYAADLVPLSLINDLNNWIGRSQWDNDALFDGSFNEFRIHGSVLTAQEILASYSNLDPGVVDYDPGTALSVTMSDVKNNMVIGNIQMPTFSASFSFVGSVDLEAPDLDSLTSSDTNVVSIDVAGRLVAVGAGAATITATIGTAFDSEVINVSASNPTLENRWSFNESPGSSTVVDSVGGQNGTVVASSTTNVTLTGTQVSFPGEPTATAPYIDLPDGIISSKTNMTVEVWFTWPGIINNTRIFDFGSSTKTNANDASGTEVGAMALAPSSGGSLRAVIRTNYPDGTQVNLWGTGPSVSVEHHVAYVFAPDSLLARLYLDGVVQDTDTAPFPLSLVPDTNNWLGLSQWGQDPGFNGSINELRIYEGVLTDLDVALHRHAGPDVPTVSDPGNLVSLSVPDVGWLLGDPDPELAQAKLLATFDNYTDVEIQGISGVSMETQDTNVFTTTSSGLMTQVGAGSAGLVGSYGGMSTTGTITVLGPISIDIVDFAGALTAGTPTNATLLANYATTNNVDVTTFNGVSWSTLDPAIATVGGSGVITPYFEGSTTLRAVYGGLTNDLAISVVYPPGYDPYRIDDFESYALGNVGAVAAPPWTTSEGGGTAFYGNIASDAGNQFITQYGSGDYRDLRKETPWRLSAKGTLNFDVRTIAETNIDLAIGLSRANNMNWYSDYGPCVRLTTDPGGDANGVVSLDTYDDTTWINDVATLNVGQWYDIKLVIDTTSAGIGEFDLYVDDVLAYSNSGFRYDYNNDPLDTLVLMAGSGANEVIWIDNAYLYPPPTLSVSKSGSNVLISWRTGGSTGYVLEGTTVLGTGASWSTNGIPAPMIMGDYYQVTLPSPSGTGYYRLKK